MTNHERLTEQYEDALFALLMDSVAEEEGKQALELNERLKADPAAEVPESVRRRCEATIRREFNRKKAKKLGKMTWKVVRRLSVAVMLMVVLLTTAMAASEEFRLSVLNAVINTYDRYTELTFRGESGNTPVAPSVEDEELNDDCTYYYGLGFEWIPEGYEIGDDGLSKDNGTRRISFYDDMGHVIDVDVIKYSSGGIYQFDSEDSQKIDVSIQGYSAELYIKDPSFGYRRLLVWIDQENDYVIQITASGPADNAPTSEDILLLAEGLHW
ncbi:DUF4367 domain-containing protein [Clostridium sp. DFI.5.61]|uniref:DUF4367 domain-containing protein n=1 Tax=Clostridium sp. DFI.5.61 TaxID=2965279 RepID=UPI00210DF306|nr:DUF4367 domain-containing protein [Clostridium sp. DFI.5.61]MCB5925252.1 DUF4367 domain-containing protein [bacterium 210820-DFI.5.26]MCQ5158188.1 DUF4367 domain-containing protein [Clostridium sp. DFI.5.61]